MNNEKGTILPMTIVFFAIFLMALTTAINLYATEKNFYYENTEKLKADHILRLGTSDIKDILKKNGGVSQKGFLFYPHGDLFYEITNQNLNIMMVHCYVTTKQDRKMEAIFKYDLVLQKMVEWIEI